jgi:hypothetical protein
MSPKSRGRPPGRGRTKKQRPRRLVHELHPADRVIVEARRLVDTASRLDAEHLASAWLGEAWVAAGLGERDPEARLILAVATRASRTPTPAALAAICALRLVAPASEHRLLDETVDVLQATVGSRPAWTEEPPPTAARAWRGADPWDSQRVLMVEYAGQKPHTLLADILLAGGNHVLDLELLEPDAASTWASAQTEAPMPLTAQPVEDVLGELADSLRQTDMTWPRQDEASYVELRMLAAARCAAVPVPQREWEPIPDEERSRLIDDFVAASGLPDDDVTRSMADLCVDYGDGYIVSGVLAWSPLSVELFLGDWVPRKVALDAEQRAALPDVLRAWVRFALERRGVAPQWIEPAVAAVDEHEREFRERFDDERAWGPAKTIATALQERGIDLTDREAVDDAIRAYNAEQLARRLIDSGPEGDSRSDEGADPSR